MLPCGRLGMRDLGLCMHESYCTDVFHMVSWCSMNITHHDCKVYLAVCIAPVLEEQFGSAAPRV